MVDHVGRQGITDHHVQSRAQSRGGIGDGDGVGEIVSGLNRVGAGGFGDAQAGRRFYRHRHGRAYGFGVSTAAGDTISLVDNRRPIGEGPAHRHHKGAGDDLTNAHGIARNPGNRVGQHGRGGRGNKVGVGRQLVGNGISAARSQVAVVGDGQGIGQVLAGLHSGSRGDGLADLPHGRLDVDGVLHRVHDGRTEDSGGGESGDVRQAVAPGGDGNRHRHGHALSGAEGGGVWERWNERDVPILSAGVSDGDRLGNVAGVLQRVGENEGRAGQSIGHVVAIEQQPAHRHAFVRADVIAQAERAGVVVVVNVQVGVRVTRVTGRGAGLQV